MSKTTKPKKPKKEETLNTSVKPSVLYTAATHQKDSLPNQFDGSIDSVHHTWEDISNISKAIGEYIAQMANDINESVELVKRVGCDHIKEFNIAVEKTNKDFEKFITDYMKLKAQHEGKSGVISDPDDLAKAINIFENYSQFNAFFQGVMHHSLITFTEYALEAKDRLQEKLKEEEATQANEAQEPTESTHV